MRTRAAVLFLVVGFGLAGCAAEPDTLAVTSPSVDAPLEATTTTAAPVDTTAPAPPPTAPPTTEAPPETAPPATSPPATAAPQPAPTTPAPVAAVAAVGCDPSYPGVCIPPGPPDLDCADVSYRRFSVVGADPHRFDADNDGIGCESG